MKNFRDPRKRCINCAFAKVSDTGLLTCYKKFGNLWDYWNGKPKTDGWICSVIRGSACNGKYFFQKSRPQPFLYRLKLKLRKASKNTKE